MNQKGAKSTAAIDLQIARLLIENPAATDQEIADRLGVKRMTVNRRRRGDSVTLMMSSALSIPVDELRRLLVKSLRRLEELLDDPDPRVRGSAATNILKLAPQTQLPNHMQTPRENDVIVYSAVWGDQNPAD